MREYKMATLLKLFIVGLFAFMVITGVQMQVTKISAAPIRPEATPPLPDRPVLPVPVATKPKPKVFINMRVTAYCPCKICCGRNARGMCKDGGKAIGQLVAADWNVLPKGTLLYIPGYGKARVRDTGSAIKGNRLDVFFPDHQTAKVWGVRYLKVEVLN